MSNDCWNDITVITYDDSQRINNIFDNTLRGVEVKVEKRWQNGMRITFLTNFGPDFDWLESLTHSYPAWWIKNYWWDEGGTAGVWVGYHKKNKKIIREMDWDDSCIEEISSREMAT